MSGRGTVRVAIALGGNQGNRMEMLRTGLASLRRIVDEVEVSPVYETEPVHVAEQPAFLNACCVGRTRLKARQLLSALQDIERLAGRRPGGVRFGPRPLDLDLLLYGGFVIEDSDLIIPHPRLHERAFVLMPLADVAPNWEVPSHGGRTVATVVTLARACTEQDRQGVSRIDEELS